MHPGITQAVFMEVKNQQTLIKLAMPTYGQDTSCRRRQALLETKHLWRRHCSRSYLKQTSPGHDYYI